MSQTIKRARLFGKKAGRYGEEYSVKFLDSEGNEVLLGSPGTAGPVTSTGVNYDILQTDDVVLATAGGVTIKLPKAADSFADGRGRDFVVRNTAGTSITVGVVTSGGNVDGGATVTLTTNTAKRFRSDGTNWWSIA